MLAALLTQRARDMHILTAAAQTTIQELWTLINEAEDQGASQAEFIEQQWVMAAQVCMAYALQHRAAGYYDLAEAFESAAEQAEYRRPFVRRKNDKVQLAIARSLRDIHT